MSRRNKRTKTTVALPDIDASNIASQSQFELIQVKPQVMSVAKEKGRADACIEGIPAYYAKINALSEIILIVATAVAAFFNTKIVQSQATKEGQDNLIVIVGIAFVLVFIIEYCISKILTIVHFSQDYRLKIKDLESEKVEAAGGRSELDPPEITSPLSVAQLEGCIKTVNKVHADYRLNKTVKIAIMSGIGVLISEVVMVNVLNSGETAISIALSALVFAMPLTIGYLRFSMVGKDEASEKICQKYQEILDSIDIPRLRAKIEAINGFLDELTGREAYRGTSITEQAYREMTAARDSQEISDTFLETFKAEKERIEAEEEAENLKIRRAERIPLPSTKLKVLKLKKDLLATKIENRKFLISFIRENLLKIRQKSSYSDDSVQFKRLVLNLNEEQSIAESEINDFKAEIESINRSLQDSITDLGDFNKDS